MKIKELEKENRRLQRLLSEQDFFNKFLRVTINNYFSFQPIGMSVDDILLYAPSDLSDEITDV
jgi:hypothetical protein